MRSPLTSIPWYLSTTSPTIKNSNIGYDALITIPFLTNFSELNLPLTRRRNLGRRNVHHCECICPAVMFHNLIFKRTHIAKRAWSRSSVVIVSFSSVILWLIFKTHFFRGRGGRRWWWGRRRLWRFFRVGCWGLVFIVAVMPRSCLICRLG